MIRDIAAALVLLASPAFAQTAPPQEGPITCTSPVAPDDNERSLKQRFGKDAVVQDLPGAEGETYRGVVLFPKARDRRIEIAFTDDKVKRASGLTLRDAGKTSFWNVSGVTIGSSLADVQKANGKPFLVSGFRMGLWRLRHRLEGRCARPAAAGRLHHHDPLRQERRRAQIALGRRREGGLRQLRAGEMGAGGDGGVNFPDK